MPPWTISVAPWYVSPSVASQQTPSPARKKRRCKPPGFDGEHPKQNPDAGNTSSSPCGGAGAATAAGSDTFEDGRDAHPATDAHRHEAGRLVAPFELVEDRPDEHCAGRAERMAESDGAAVHVDDV